MPYRKHRGFTLIELVVVVIIISMLAAIAYPNYIDYVFRARRADGKEMMMRIASAQERYYTNLNRYTNDLATLGLGNTSEGGFYTFGIVLGNVNQTYTVTATPVGAQALDKCGNLTLTSSGFKDRSGNDNNGKCW